MLPLRSVVVVILLSSHFTPLVAQETDTPVAQPQEVQGISAPQVSSDTAIEPQADLASKLAVLQEKLGRLTLDQENLSASKQGLEEEIRRLKKDNSKLEAQVRALQEQAIDKVTLRDGDKYVTLSSAAFRLEADRYGSIRARLFDSAGNPVIIGGKAATIDTPPSPQIHTVKFSPLPPRTEFSLSLSAIRKDGTEGKVTQLGNFNFKTDDDRIYPSISIAGVEPSSTSLALRYRLENAPAYITIECRQYQEGMGGYKPCPSRGAIRFDELDRPIGEEVKNTGEHSEIFGDLKEDTYYSFHLKAYTEKGAVASTSEQALLYKTLPAPVPFNFSGPLILEITPAEVRLTWRASTSIKGASFSLNYKDRQVAVVRDAVPNDTDPSKVTIGLPLTELNSILGKALETPPTLIASMTDGKDTVARELQFSYAFPKNRDEIRQLALTEGQKKSIEKLVAAATEKKIDWKAVAKTGIPFILSFF